VYSTINISDYGGSIAANVILCILVAAPLPLIFYFGLTYVIIRKGYTFYFGTTPMVFYCTVVCVSIPLICYTNTNNLRNWWQLHDGTTYTGDIADLMGNINAFQSYQFFNLTGLYLYKGSLQTTPIPDNSYYCYSRYGSNGYRIFCSIILVPANYDPNSTVSTPVFAACETGCSRLNTPFTTCDSLGARDTVGDGSCFAYWYNWANGGQGQRTLLSKKLSPELPSYSFVAARQVLNANNFPIISINPQAYATEIVDEPKVQQYINSNFNYVITVNAIIYSITYFVWLVYGIGKIIIWIKWEDD